MKNLFCILALLALSSCARSSGVIKTGPDTFTISASASFGRGGVPAAKKIAYEEATEECTKRGNFEVYTLNENTFPSTFTDGMSRVELVFRCLSADDPEFKRQK